MEDNYCPKCGTYDLMTFTNITWLNGTDGFSIVQCQHCGFEGKACYKIAFDRWEDSNGKPINV